METQIAKNLEQQYLQVRNKVLNLTPSHQPPVILLAVSKGQAAAKIRCLYDLGQDRFGENYVQELIAKAESLKDLPLTWVYIGHLQSNKIKKIVSVACEIQTIGNLKHATLVSQYAIELGKTPYPVWIEVKASDSTTKHGCLVADLPALARSIENLPGLQLKGIMVIPPAEYQDATYPMPPPLYSDLRQLASTTGEGLLSLGMSGDLRLAIEAGTNLVRIGTALFGSRLS